MLKVHVLSVMCAVSALKNQNVVNLVLGMSPVTSQVRAALYMYIYGISATDVRVSEFWGCALCQHMTWNEANRLMHPYSDGQDGMKCQALIDVYFGGGSSESDVR